MQVIDRYELREELGAGAFGRVYRARHRVLDRVVALKVLEAHSEKERFLREAAVLARLDHPNIVKIYDSGTTDDGHAFLALELLEGETLSQRLRETGAQPVAEAIWIVDQILAALDAAHAQGIVHRDLKHPNVFLAQQGGEVAVKVLDFGIAKVAGAGRLTVTGTVVGTPRYMAPEVVRGGEADTRADLWATALILYELLVAEPAYAGTPRDALDAIVEGPPPSLRQRAPHLPALLLEVLDVALQYEPDRRFANAGAFREALRRAGETRPVRRTTQTRFATGSLDAFDSSIMVTPPRDDFEDGTVTSVDQGPHWSQRPPPPDTAPTAAGPSRGLLIAASLGAALLGAAVVGIGVALSRDSDGLETNAPPPAVTPAEPSAPKQAEAPVEEELSDEASNGAAVADELPLAEAPPEEKPPEPERAPVRRRRATPPRTDRSPPGAIISDGPSAPRTTPSRMRGSEVLDAWSEY